MHKPDISIEEAKLAGIDINDLVALKNLKEKLDSRDYEFEPSAKESYATASVERLQLLRQIKYLLKDGMGFSTLYNLLEPRRGANARSKSETASCYKYNLWQNLASSTDLRSFVEKHSDFLGGRILDNKKWESHFDKPQ